MHQKLLDREIPRPSVPLLIRKSGIVVLLLYVLGSWLLLLLVGFFVGEAVHVLLWRTPTIVALLRNIGEVVLTHVQSALWLEGTAPVKIS